MTNSGARLAQYENAQFKSDSYIAGPKSLVRFRVRFVSSPWPGKILAHLRLESEYYITVIGTNNIIHNNDMCQVQEGDRETSKETM